MNGKPKPSVALAQSPEEHRGKAENHFWERVGFKVDRVDEGHFGLEGIRERAKVFGGRANVKSQLRRGTEIVVELPFGPYLLLRQSRLATWGE